MKIAFAALLFPAAVQAANRTSAPPGCLTVGAGGYSTIQSAVDFVESSSPGTTPPCIFIEPGNYHEQVLISKRTASANMSVYGYTLDTDSYSANEVTISYNLSQVSRPNNDETATLRVKAVNFKMYNVNVANTFGEGSQAVALSAYSASGYYACQFTGYQDTLLSQEGYQLYAKSMIQGATDFIFGQRAAAWFEQCDIRVLPVPVDLHGFITASGRNSTTIDAYYAFNNCDIAATDGYNVTTGSFYLGRPWRASARVAFQNTSMTAVINSTGWSVWDAADERLDWVFFGEYGNTGAGAVGTRANFSTAMDAPLPIASVLGANYTSAIYYDASYM